VLCRHCFVAIALSIRVAIMFAIMLLKFFVPHCHYAHCHYATVVNLFNPPLFSLSITGITHWHHSLHRSLQDQPKCPQRKQYQVTVLLHLNLAGKER